MKDYNQNSHFLSFLLISLHYLILNASGNNLTDQLALLEFKNSITNDPDGILASWNDSLHFCNWLGITCNTQQRVTSLSLSSCNLAGTLSPHISNFTFLQTINLINNSFHGHIPSQIGNLLHLQTLNLTTNSFTGQIPPNLTRCFELRTVLVEHNSIEGTIPEDIGLLSKLTRFRMGSNNLTGQLPASIGNLSQLVEFAVAYNNLVGKIPETETFLLILLASCQQLNLLDVSGNKLTGAIPRQIFSLSSLSGGLCLSRNSFVGELPGEIGNLENLEVLDLSYNNLTGGIPISIGDCKTLKTLFLQSNSFDGEIPSALASIKDMERLDLSMNKFTGEIPSGLQRIQALQYLNLSFNDLQGDVPDKGVFANIGFLSLTGNALLCGGENIRLAHKSLLAECNALKNVRHRNLVRVLTYCSSLDHKGNDFKALVFEFMSNGSLEDWLHSDRNLMSLVQRLNIMVDVASALHYLHDLCETPVVHCDLKPSNVLLDADMVAHVGDFGLARILSSNNNSPGNESSTIGIRGTFGYAPPGKETALIIVIECCYI
ncbi:Receptor kinase-like protein Xa21 [Linum grandiflorum]